MKYQLIINVWDDELTEDDVKNRMEELMPSHGIDIENISQIKKQSNKLVTLKETGVYKDGGTKELQDKHGKKYFQDFRIGSQTKGEFFDRYPGDFGATKLNKNDFEVKS